MEYQNCTTNVPKIKLILFRLEIRASTFFFSNMACSKIFSGDISELTYKIIQHFKSDFSTLYLCILVNRLWCRLVIPLLWEDPFSISTKNYHFIEIYLYYLNEDSKAKFIEYGIDDNLLTSNNTLFNYPSFIKYLNIHNIFVLLKSGLKLWWIIIILIIRNYKI
jgi:hypothetical protein